jgi:hypothetical protein
MNANEIESAIEHAINALSLAKLALSKAERPTIDYVSDVLRKADLAEPQPSDIAKRALDMLADLTRQVDALKAADDARVNADAIRKTCVVQS